MASETCDLDNLRVRIEKNGIVFFDESNLVEIRAKYFRNFLKIVKTIYTTEENERIGRIIQLSHTHVAYFRANAVFFTLRNSNNAVQVNYVFFDQICDFIRENFLKSGPFDAYEKTILSNFVAIFGCLTQEKRKHILTAINDRNEQIIQEVVTSVLQGSSLNHRHVFYRSVVQKLLFDNLNLLELVSYTIKVAENRHEF